MNAPKTSKADNRAYQRIAKLRRFGSRRIKVLIARASDRSATEVLQLVCFARRG